VTSSEHLLFITVEFSSLKAAKIRENLWQKEELFLLDHFIIGLKKTKVMDSQVLR